MSWRDRVASLLGVSAYTAAPVDGMNRSLDDAGVVAVRTQMGGQLQPFPVTQTRWFLSDLEQALQAADWGDLSIVGRLARWMRGDGVYAGHLAARCGKAVRLPKKFTGDPEMVSALEGRVGVRSRFDDMFPPTELQRFAENILVVGACAAELVPVKGRDYPVMVTLEPEHLRYVWSENRWYYNSIAGRLPITPGDGRWMLGTLGRMSPWNVGIWQSCGKAAINKAHAELNIANWEHKWANPARVGTAPAGSTDEQKQSWFQKIAAWALNPVFLTPPGYDVKLVETNGRGYESPEKTIARAERTYALAIRGEEVTSDGGKGFGNAEVPERVLTGLIADTADVIAFTINTQGIPQWVVNRTIVDADGKVRTEPRYGEQALAVMPVLELAAKPAKDLQAQAQTLIQSATGAKAWIDLAESQGSEVDFPDICTEYGIPIKGDIDGDGTPDVEGNDAPANDVQGPDDAAALAKKMTELGIERCEHGSRNRCRLCGIERTRDFEVSEAGAPQWKVAWRPIVKQGAPAPAAGGEAA